MPMTITLIDSAAAMRRILDSASADRPGLVRELWEPMAGMYSFLPSSPDLLDVHRQSMCFPLDAGEEVDARLRQGLAALEDADAWKRVSTVLEEGVAALTAADPGVHVPDLQVLIVLADPTDRHVMDEVQGLTAFGGISGFIVLTLWPCPQVLDRLEAIALHELHHNLRYGPGGVVWDPMTVTVGEQVVAEGLADAFAEELQGLRGLTHFVADEARSDDAVLAKIVSGLGTTGMQDFAAWVLGDATARRMGAEPVGLPTGAGYAAGLRIVRAYLEETGQTAAQSVRTPGERILEVALPRLRDGQGIEL